MWELRFDSCLPGELVRCGKEVGGHATRAWHEPGTQLTVGLGIELAGEDEKLGALMY